MSLGNLLTTCACLLVTTMAAIADGPKDLPVGLAMKDQATIEAAGGEIDAYTAYWTAQLAASEPARVKDARSRLIKPPQTSGATSIFLNRYSAGALPALTRLIQSGTIIQATNAIEVVRTLGTANAAFVLRDAINPQRQPKSQVRIVAAGALRSAIAAFRKETLTFTQQEADRLVREVGTAAGQETNWVAFQSDVGALAAVAANRAFTDPTRSQALAQEFAALSAATKRASQGGADAGLIQGLRRCIDLVMRQDLEISKPQEKADFRKAALGFLNGVVALGAKPPVADRELREAFACAARDAGGLQKKFGAVAAPESADPAKTASSGGRTGT